MRNHVIVAEHTARVVFAVRAMAYRLLKSVVSKPFSPLFSLWQGDFYCVQ